MEKPEQPEIPPRSDGSKEYEGHIERLARDMGVEPRKMIRVSQQMQSLMTAYCEDTALAIIDALENHGPLAGLEGWRRLYTEQRGTISQRTDSLRDKIIYPERVQNL